MITFNESEVADNVYHADISWISKFPQEFEVLFVPHVMRIRHIEQTTQTQEEHTQGQQDPDQTEIEEWEARVVSIPTRQS